MPILEHTLKKTETSSVPPDKIDSEVLEIISSLPKGYRAFIYASLMYNSTFFKEESHEFKVQLCTALKAHYPTFPNSFWDKAVQL